MLEDAAAEIRLELVDDEVGQTALEFGSLAKAGPVAGDDLESKVCSGWRR
jgi:hypothetical protein